MQKIVGIGGRDFIQIVIGMTILAIGITWFMSPLGLVAGGVSGLAIVIKEVSQQFFGSGIPLYVTNLVLNIPLFLIVIKQRGFRFAQRSLYAVLWVSFAFWYCDLIPQWISVGDDLLLGAVFGGALMGTGIGMVLRISASTGGTDMLASIIKFRFPAFPIVTLIRGIDGLIILSGFYVFGVHKGLYAILALVVSSYMISTLLSGMHFAKSAYIISNKNEEISREIIQQLGRGNTGIKATGMYTQQEQQMLFVVVYPKQVGKLRSIVKEIDPNAFLTITNATEVLGEGFSRDYDSLGL